jgi:hypothetical protein
MLNLSTRARLFREGDAALWMPNLDAVPPWPHQWGPFLSQFVSLNSVRSVSLSPAPTSYILAEHGSNLGSLDSLVLPEGLDLEALPSHCLEGVLSSKPLHMLTAYCNCFSRASLLRFGDAISQVHILQLHDVPALELSAILVSVLNAGVARLELYSCHVSDGSVSLLCRSLSSDQCMRLRALSFQDCELSDWAEQQLLQSLESGDGQCVVTIEGGTTLLSDGSGIVLSPEADVSCFAERPARRWQTDDNSELGLLATAHACKVSEWGEDHFMFAIDADDDRQLSRFGFALDQS